VICNCLRRGAIAGRDCWARLLGEIAGRDDFSAVDVARFEDLGVYQLGC
jgi:hypothetical protein